MTLYAPSYVVAAQLNGVTIPYGSEVAKTQLFTLGTNLFRGPIRDDGEDGTFPDICVFCHTTNSEAPKHYHDNKDKLVALVSVFLRMERNRWEDGEDLARGIWKALQRNIPTSYGYQECESTDSEPLFQGVDGIERPIFQTQFRLIRVE